MTDPDYIIRAQEIGKAWIAGALQRLENGTTRLPGFTREVADAVECLERYGAVPHRGEPQEAAS